MILPKCNKVNHLPEGEYFGTIIDVAVGKNENYVWFTINVAKVNKVLSVSVDINYKLYNNFIENFFNEIGEVDSDDVIGTKIKFSLIDKTFNDVTYSKFASLELEDKVC